MGVVSIETLFKIMSGVNLDRKEAYGITFTKDTPTLRD